MKRKNNTLIVLFLSGLCCLTLFGGCGSNEKTPSNEKDATEIVEDNQTNADVMGSGNYKPSEFTIPRQDSYEYSYMGLKFSLPESLMDRMDKKEAAMVNLAEANEAETALTYGLIVWKSMTEEQRDMEVASGGNQFYDWVDSLTPIGAIGVYDNDNVNNLDKLTGCKEHKEIGKSEDGAYTYYLSVNPDAVNSQQDEINDISYEITDMISIQEEMRSGEEQAAGMETRGVGDFSMQDINGETYVQDMFADYDLTMVNVFTTWCTPCVNEIPELQKLWEEMKDQGVNVVGIVLDSIDASGSIDEETVEKAKVLAERTGASYPFLIPDQSYMNGRLAGINAVPETFFVDKEGNFVGETYSGSHSLEEWKSIVETELKGVEQ